MSLYRKLEIQNDLPKITKGKLICYFSPKLWPKILNYVNFSILNHYLIAFKKNEIKNQASGGTRTLGLGPLNSCAIRCAKKTAENVFNMYPVQKKSAQNMKHKTIIFQIGELFLLWYI